MTRPAITAYGALVRLYPRGFRTEYGPDLVSLLTDQLRDEPAWRVLPRTAVDFALTVPARHLETHMNRSATRLVAPLLGLAGITVLVSGSAAGGAPWIVFGLALVLLALAAVAFSREHTSGRSASPRLCWQLLLSGGAVLGTLVLGEAVGIDGVPWIVLVAVVLSGWTLVAAGVVVGVFSAVTRLRQRPVSP